MSSPPVYSPRAVAMAALALAIGGFGIGTGEFAIMGLLPNVAEHLQVSAPEVGHLISAYALGVVIGAPLIAVMAAHLSRSTLLFGLMIWFVVGNFASAFAPGYYSLMAFRFLTGMPHGAYFGVAALVAASMVPPHRRGQAIGRVMLGLTVAALIGNPLATGLGQWLGWRAAFAAVGTIGIITLIMLNKFVPHQADQPVSSARQELGALRRGQVWFTLGIGAIGFGGLFAVFSYIAPTLTQVTGLGESWVPIALAVMGAGMIAGNIAGGWLADRALVKSIGGVLVWTMLVLAIFPWMAGNTWTMMLDIFLIGTGLALGPVLQIRLMDVAADAQTLAASLNHSAFNMANALGAWLGGVAITAGYGWTSTGWVGAMLALAGLLLFGLSLLHMRRMETVSGAA
ncbi:MFS transporter [Pigmentiphaga litoralis]|uniref:MFS transporter n=1 Tax=Pigmentiphaga litoralis TaxID=516702 RepID=UPI003B436F96